MSPKETAGRPLASSPLAAQILSKYLREGLENVEIQWYTPKPGEGVCSSAQYPYSGCEYPFSNEPASASSPRWHKKMAGIQE